MSAEKAIHDDWASFIPLTRLVPADHVLTGLPPIYDDQGNRISANLGYDYVALLVKAAADVWRDSEGCLGFTEQVTFYIVSASYDRARDIDQAVMDRYNGRAFTLDDISVLDMRPSNRVENENEDDGVWEIMREFRVNCYQQLVTA